MPKTVAEKTRHLSFRIDVEDNARIEKIRAAMEARFGIFPQRSDVLRKILDYGIAAFCKRNDIDLTAPVPVRRGEMSQARKVAAKVAAKTAVAASVKDVEKKGAEA